MTPSSTCPLCGNHLDFDGLVLLPDRGLVMRGNESVRLTSLQMQVAMILYRAAPLVVTQGQIMFHLYEHRGNDPQMKILDQVVFHLRRKLQPFGIEIINEHAIGFRMKFAGPTRLVEEAKLTSEAAA